MGQIYLYFIINQLTFIYIFSRIYYLFVVTAQTCSIYLGPVPNICGQHLAQAVFGRV